jgi:hypothetical protein
MQFTRITGFFVVLAILSGSSLGCRKRKTDSTDATAGAASGEAPAAVVVEPPKALPEGVKPLPKPPTKSWGERTKHEKIVQMDFWLNQHQFGDAGQKSKISGEVRSASMNPAERKEFDEMRKRYGYAEIAP